MPSTKELRRPLKDELILCVIIAVVGIILPEFYPLTQRPIPYQEIGGDVILDFDLMQEWTGEETVPSKMLAVLCLIVPALVIIIMGGVLGPMHDGHASACTFLIATGSTLFLTGILKRYFGCFRPNFYAMCDFDTETLECRSDSDEGRKSVPSGHSSVAFSSMTMLTLFFLGKVGIYNGLKEVGDSQLSRDRKFAIYPSLKKKIFAYIALIPMALAAFIAASRVYDNVHHPADIILGSLIGFVCASFSYSLWYPSIYSEHAGKPLQAIAEELSTPEEDDAKPLASYDHLVVI